MYIGNQSTPVGVVKIINPHYPGDFDLVVSNMDDQSARQKTWVKSLRVLMSMPLISARGVNWTCHLSTYSLKKVLPLGLGAA